MVDAAHRNDFLEAELVTLLDLISNRGFDVEILGDFDSAGELTRIAILEEGLRGADALVVILPRDSYLPREAALVEKFAEKGGEVLLVGDPARRHNINSLASSFGLDFQPDYLYNISENDLNFQHIILRDFQPDPLTQGLNEVVFYTAGSVESSGPGLAFTDGQNTRSSFIDQLARYYPFARGSSNNVLALADFTFMVPPHDNRSDNGQLIANIANFLTRGDRDFDLGDFPHFLKGDVDILAEDPSLSTLAVSLKNKLADLGIDARPEAIEDTARDTVILGLYGGAPRANAYLSSSGIRLEEETAIVSGLEFNRGETGVVMLSRAQDRDALVLLAETAEGLQAAVDRLTGDDFSGGLVDDFVGVYENK